MPCTCKQGQKATPTSFGGTLDFVYSDSNRSFTWKGPRQYCNPYNCSNTECKNKGCAQAVAGWCGQYGKLCPDHKKYCWKNGKDPCPAGGKTPTARQPVGVSVPKRGGSIIPATATGNCSGNCWTGHAGQDGTQTVKVCGSNCADARSKFCAQYGKQCPGGRKCYGSNGEDPCPSTSSSSDPDTDCNNFWGLGDIGKVFCQGGKSLTKGGGAAGSGLAGLADPLGKYLPFIALGGGVLLLIVLLKGR